MRARWRWAADSPRVAGVALTAPCAWLKCSQAGRNYVALTTQRSETPPSTQAAVSTQCRQMGLRARRDTQHSSSRNIDGDMLRATYRPVAGFPDLRVLRPAPTAARPPTPLPGFAGYRRSIASRHPAGDGAETALPSSQDDHPHVQRPIRRRVPQRPLLEPGRLPWPSPSHNRLGTLFLRPKTAVANDAYSGFTRVADRAVDPAPLRTQPLDHARGHHYRGPRRLPGPDSHRQAALNLSLLYVISTIPS